LAKGCALDQQPHRTGHWQDENASSHCPGLQDLAGNAGLRFLRASHNLFLLFKMDFANGREYRQQIKTFRLKYIFLAGKIIRMARSVVLKLSKNILIKRSMQIVFPEKTRFFVQICCLYLYKAEKNHFLHPFL
jgi:hypothetical protein